MTTPEQFVAAIQKRGSDAVTPRDAAHEACHALKWEVMKKWTRDNIHAKKPKARGRGFAARMAATAGIRDEIEARAVEQLVCAKLGVNCGSVEKWAWICWLETLKNEDIALPHGDWLADQIRAAMDRPSSFALAERVIAIAGAT